MCQFFSFAFDPKTCEVLALFGADRDQYSNPDSFSTIAKHYGREEGKLFHFEIPLKPWDLLRMKRGETLFDVLGIEEDAGDEKEFLNLYYEGGLPLEGNWYFSHFRAIFRWQEDNTPAIVEAGEKVFHLDQHQVGLQVFACRPNTVIELERYMSLHQLSDQIRKTFRILLDGNCHLASQFKDIGLLMGEGVLLDAENKKLWDLWTGPVNLYDQQYEEGTPYRCRLECKNFIDEYAFVKRIFVTKDINFFVSKQYGLNRVGKEGRIVIYPVHFVQKEEE